MLLVVAVGGYSFGIRGVERLDVEVERINWTGCGSSGMCCIARRATCIFQSVMSALYGNGVL